MGVVMSIEYTLGELLEAEIQKIDEFRITESERQGRELDRNEAAEIWIGKYAAQFRIDFEAALEDQRSGR
jgi:hypothetical protein